MSDVLERRDEEAMSYIFMGSDVIVRQNSMYDEKGPVLLTMMGSFQT